MFTWQVYYWMGMMGRQSKNCSLPLFFFSKLISNTRKLKLFISLLELLWRDLLLSAYRFVKSNKVPDDQSKSLISRPTVIKKSLCLYTVYRSVYHWIRYYSYHGTQHNWKQGILVEILVTKLSRFVELFIMEVNFKLNQLVTDTAFCLIAFCGIVMLDKIHLLCV